MTTLIHFLFCESPFQAKQPDPSFEDEFQAAKQNGFETLLFNYEDLVSTDRSAIATRKIQAVNELTQVIYRGWMLKPEQYDTLYDSLLTKNYRLINSPKEYQNCHYLPDSLAFIVAQTPATVFEELKDGKSIDRLLEKAKIFKNQAVIIKDYVKSEKHDWETACYVENASDTKKLRQSILNLIQLRDKYLNKGIVIREFVKLKPLVVHSKSGMPLTEEYRLFFFNGKLLGIYNYWEEGLYVWTKPDTEPFEAIALQIESNFFSMDIARKEDGAFTIIELGDGQVTGLPEQVMPYEFYNTLKKCLSTPTTP